MSDRTVPDTAAADTAKVFWSGRSQAVRLPKAYRFDTDEVTIRREGNLVVLEPRVAENPAWPDWIAKLDALGSPDHDFVVAAGERDGPDGHKSDADTFGAGNPFDE